MKPIAIHRTLGRLPYMTLEQGTYIYDIIKRENLSHVLELGFYHGVSSMYFAGALAEIEGGLCISIDRSAALSLEPNIYSLAEKCGLSDRLRIITSEWSYTYHLLELLEEGWRNRFDLIYVDGGHTWELTGMAVSLSAHLLRPGGWLLLDDLDWTVEKSYRRKQQEIPFRLAAPASLPGVRKAFEQLVKLDARFEQETEYRSWGVARRSSTL